MPFLDLLLPVLCLSLTFRGFSTVFSQAEDYDEAKRLKQELEVLDAA